MTTLGLRVSLQVRRSDRPGQADPLVQRCVACLGRGQQQQPVLAVRGGYGALLGVQVPRRGRLDLHAGPATQRVSHWETVFPPGCTVPGTPSPKFSTITYIYTPD